MVTFDITSRPISDLTGRVAGTYVPTDRAWDCSVGSLPFLFANNLQTPIQRSTADFRRQRVDQERSPGEWALDSGVWRRSQQSWHLGAGILTAEPLTTGPDEARFQFLSSLGIDVMSIRGQATLLPLMTSASTSTSSNLFVNTYGSGLAILSAGATVSRHTKGGSTVAATWGGVGAISSTTDDGTTVYIAAAGDGIYSMPMASGVGTKIWDLAGSTTVTIAWVKSRLIACIDAKMYELVGVGPTLPTATLTLTNTAFKFTAIAEGPTAIYCAGYSGNKSLIYMFGLDTTLSSGLLPMLTKGTIIAELPAGEIINDMKNYLGGFLGIASNKGIRVATISTSIYQVGFITYGALHWTIINGGGPVYSLANYDRFIFGGTGLTSGAGTMRLDLSAPLQGGAFYPYAADRQTYAVGHTVANAFYQDGTAILGVAGVGFFEETGALEVSGALNIPPIAFSTTENKSWLSAIISGSASTTSSIAMTAIGPNATLPVYVGSLAQTAGKTSLSLAVAAPRPIPILTITLTLNRGTAVTDTPILTFYSVSAVPAPAKTRLVQVPLLCYDNETDRNGNKLGTPGSSWARLSQLEALEDSGQIFYWQDFTTGEARLAMVEKITMNRITPPSRDSTGAGGVIELVVRLL